MSSGESPARLRLVPAYVGIGSNLEDPALQVANAIRALAEIEGTYSHCASSLFVSQPLGEIPQPDYVNAVCGLLTALDATALLRALHELERSAGRDRTADVRWGPRVLDLDLLVMGRETIDRTDLVLPHPGISSRNFVLLPLAEIAPWIDVPGQGKVAQLIAGIDRKTIRRLE